MKRRNLYLTLYLFHNVCVTVGLFGFKESKSIFKTCTLLFLNVKRTPYFYYKSVQQSFSEDCASSQNCVMFQWNISKNSQNSSIPQSITAEENLEKENIVKIHYHLNKAFILHKFQNRCLVKFPYYRILQSILIFSMLDEFYLMQNWKRIASFRLPAYRHFVLIHLPVNTILKLTLQVTYRIWVTIIFITGDNNGLSTIAPGPVFYRSLCHESSCNLTSFVNVKPESIEEIQKFARHIVRLEKSVKSSLASDGDILLIKPSVMNIEGISMLMLRHVYNCTWDINICESSFEFLKLPDNWRHGSIANSVRYIPYGQRATKVGFGYLVIPGVNRYGHFSGNLESFLSPLESNIWYCLIILTIILLVILKVGKPGNSLANHLFWIFSTFFEQGNNGKQFKQNSYRAIIVSWLIVCNFIRCFYTSKVFTDITTDKETISLPSSLHQVFVNKAAPERYRIVSTNYTHAELVLFYGLFETTSLKNILQVYIENLYFITGLEEFKSLIDSRTFNVRLPCFDFNMFGIEYCGKPDKQVLPKENLVLIFDLLHMRDYVRIKHLPVLLGSRKIYENDEEPILPKTSLYSILRYTAYIEFSVQVISNLYSSGLAQYVDEILTSSNLFRKELRHAIYELGISLKINYYTYARHVTEVNYKKMSGVGNKGIKHSKTVFKQEGKSMDINSVKLYSLYLVWKSFGTLSIFCIAIYVMEHARNLLRGKD